MDEKKQNLNILLKLENVYKESNDKKEQINNLQTILF